MNNSIRKYLVNLARKTSVITYQKLADECNLGLYFVEETDRQLFEQVLAEINIQ